MQQPLVDSLRRRRRELCTHSGRPPLCRLQLFRVEKNFLAKLSFKIPRSRNVTTELMRVARLRLRDRRSSTHHYARGGKPGESSAQLLLFLGGRMTDRARTAAHVVAADTVPPLQPPNVVIKEQSGRERLERKSLLAR